MQLREVHSLLSCQILSPRAARPPRSGGLLRDGGTGQEEQRAGEQARGHARGHWITSATPVADADRASVGVVPAPLNGVSRKPKLRGASAIR